MGVIPVGDCDWANAGTTSSTTSATARATGRMTTRSSHPWVVPATAGAARLRSAAAHPKRVRDDAHEAPRLPCAALWLRRRRPAERARPAARATRRPDLDGGPPQDGRRPARVAFHAG